VLRILNEGLYHLFCCKNQQSDMEISYDSQILISNSESLVVVVLSGTMEPAFRRGDILFLWMQSEHFAVGDIVVFKIDQREIPIVHRVHRVYVVCE
jgi:signal peptidase I